MKLASKIGILLFTELILSYFLSNYLNCVTCNSEKKMKKSFAKPAAASEATKLTSRSSVGHVGCFTGIVSWSHLLLSDTAHSLQIFLKKYLHSSTFRTGVTVCQNDTDMFRRSSPVDIRHLPSDTEGRAPVHLLSTARHGEGTTDLINRTPTEEKKDDDKCFTG